MLIVIDVGNTNIKVGLFEEGRLESSWRMATKMHVTSDEIGIKMISFLDYLHRGGHYDFLRHPVDQLHD